MRSGGSALTFSSASAPDVAEITEYPSPLRMASSRRTFCGTSSTARILGWAGISVSLLRATITSHLVGEFAHADGFLEVAVEALGEEALPIPLHGEGGQRDDGDPLGTRFVLEAAERFDAVHVR